MALSSAAYFEQLCRSKARELGIRAVYCSLDSKRPYDSTAWNQFVKSQILYALKNKDEKALRFLSRLRNNLLKLSESDKIFKACLNYPDIALVKEAIGGDNKALKMIKILLSSSSAETIGETIIKDAVHELSRMQMHLSRHKQLIKIFVCLANNLSILFMKIHLLDV